MNAPFDAVLGWHMNPDSCGVAKFNAQLAQRLGIPFEHVSHIDKYAHPLVSVKLSELGVKAATVLLHDRTWKVVYADDYGCPATIHGDSTRGQYRVLTFGMAHKRLRHHYESLKRQLDAEHPDYTVEMSTAIHEGTPWEAGHAESIVMMRDIFGVHLRVLGFLSDDALAKELQECDAVAVYFDPALRANNTSAWAALAAGKRLYTNRDEQSPMDPPTWDGLIEALCAK